MFLPLPFTIEMKILISHYMNQRLVLCINVSEVPMEMMKTLAFDLCFKNLFVNQLNGNALKKTSCLSDYFVYLSHCEWIPKIVSFL